MSLRAVFFDLGGTLFSYGALGERMGDALAQVARSHALDASPETLRRAYQSSVLGVMAEYSRRAYYLHRELFAEAHVRMLRSLGVADPRGEDAVGSRLSDPGGVPGLAPREGTADVLRRLRAAGLHLAVVSNIDDDQFEAIWGRMGLADLFDATTTSEEARSCKPHRRIFDVALAKAGVPAERVAFVGDSLAHDVAGANAVGMRSIWLSERQRAAGAGDGVEAPHVPDHVIADLRELPELLLG